MQILIHIESQGPHSWWWPVDVTQMMGWGRMRRLRIDSRDRPARPELQPICRILRRQSLSPDGIFAEYDGEDLVGLTTMLNMPISETTAGCIGSDITRPWSLVAAGPAPRILAEALLHFTFVLVSDYFTRRGGKPIEGLHLWNPIAVCAHCDALFLRTRSNAVYCSKQCVAAAWAERKGSEYFRIKQRESRQIRRRRSR